MSLDGSNVSMLNTPGDAALNKKILPFGEKSRAVSACNGPDSIVIFPPISEIFLPSCTDNLLPCTITPGFEPKNPKELTGDELSKASAVGLGIALNRTLSLRRR